MSSSDKVRATLVMLPASLVRVRALKSCELLDDVVVVLAGDARDLVLAREAAEVAHRAQRLVGLALAARRAFAASALNGGGARLLRREEVGERRACRRGVRSFAIGDICGSLRRPSLKSLQLEVEVARGLAGEDRELRRRPNCRSGRGRRRRLPPWLRPPRPAHGACGDAARGATAKAGEPRRRSKETGRPQAACRARCTRSVQREHEHAVAALEVDLVVAAAAHRDVLLAADHVRHRHAR